MGCAERAYQNILRPFFLSFTLPSIVKECFTQSNVNISAKYQQQVESDV